MNENQYNRKLTDRDAALRDYSVQDEETKGYVEHDGSYGNKHLTLKHKKSNESYNIKRIEEAYDSDKRRIRYT